MKSGTQRMLRMARLVKYRGSLGAAQLWSRYANIIETICARSSLQNCTTNSSIFIP